MLKPFIGVLEWAIVLVIVFHPVHRRLARKMRYRGLSALLSCLLVVLIVILPLSLLTISVALVVVFVVSNLPSQISQFMNNKAPLFEKISDWLQTRFGIDTLRSQEFLVEQLKRSSEFLLGLSWNLIGNILGGIVKAFFVVFTMYYLFRDGDKIVKRLPASLPGESTARRSDNRANSGSGLRECVRRSNDCNASGTARRFCILVVGRSFTNFMGSADGLRLHDSDCRIICRLASAFDIPDGDRTLDQSG